MYIYIYLYTYIYQACPVPCLSFPCFSYIIVFRSHPCCVLLGVHSFRVMPCFLLVSSVPCLCVFCSSCFIIFRAFPCFVVICCFPCLPCFQFCMANSFRVMPCFDEIHAFRVVPCFVTHCSV